MVLTAEQMRQVRLNQPRLSWPEQEAIFRRNWQSLIVTAPEPGSNSSSSAGLETKTSSPRLPAAKTGVVGCLL